MDHELSEAEIESLTSSEDEEVTDRDSQRSRKERGKAGRFPGTGDVWGVDKTSVPL
jgi:hypothetical protein